MAKAPLAGSVKTRLVPPLTAPEAAALNACFLRDMASNISSIAAEGTADGFAVYAPVGAESAFEGILPQGFKLLGPLGDRLCNATDDLLSDGYAAVCLINSDSPTLPRAVIEQAVDLLSKDGDRVVLGAADDGGYYLIGLKQAHRNLFERIAWSTAEVLAHTIERAGEINLAVELLPHWYDVDDATTLNRLCQELLDSGQHDGAYPAPHTREFLASIIETEGLQRLRSQPACA